jgi:hypothetical protein
MVEAWNAVYRVAYEQACTALEPSRFSQIIEPNWN